MNRWRALASVAVCIMAIAVGPTGAAADPPPKTSFIAGQVTDTSGTPLAGACVYALGPDSRGETTDARGRYRIDGMTPGSYQVSFRGCDAGNFVEQFYPGTSDFSEATAVSVGMKKPANNVDAALTAGGSITGRVIDETSGAAPGCFVVAHPKLDYTDPPNTSSHATTDAGGVFEIIGLEAGHYYVSFGVCDDLYLMQEFVGLDGAPPGTGGIAVTEGRDTALGDTALEPGGFVGGALLDSDGNPASLRVSVFEVSRSTPDLVTVGSGRWSSLLSPIAPGQYHVRFTSRFGEFAEQWWNDQPDRTTAAVVTIVARQDISGIDAHVHA